MNHRAIAVIVQLSNRADAGGDYAGGELQLRLSPGQFIDAPGCAGDAVIFPAAVLRHRVQRLRSGARRNLVWWVKGRHLGGHRGATSKIDVGTLPRRGGGVPPRASRLGWNAGSSKKQLTSVDAGSPPTVGSKRSVAGDPQGPWHRQAQAVGEAGVLASLLKAMAARFFSSQTTRS